MAMPCSLADPVDQPGGMISALHFFNGPPNDHPAENIFHQVQIIIRAPDRAVHIRDIPAPHLIGTSAVNPWAGYGHEAYCCHGGKAVPFVLTPGKNCSPSPDNAQCRPTEPRSARAIDHDRQGYSQTSTMACFSCSLRAWAQTLTGPVSDPLFPGLSPSAPTSGDSPQAPGNNAPRLCATALGLLDQLHAAAAIFHAHSFSPLPQIKSAFFFQHQQRRGLRQRSILAGGSLSPIP